MVSGKSLLDPGASGFINTFLYVTNTECDASFMQYNF